MQRVARQPGCLLAFVTATFLVSCAPGLRPPGDVAGAQQAPAAVEHFLQLVAEKDYSGMGWAFGTATGAIIQRDPLAEVEQRMFALAHLLEHDSFAIATGTPVPGRSRDTIRFDVALRRGPETLQVPFTAVRGPRDRWYVEQVSVETITLGNF